MAAVSNQPAKPLASDSAFAPVVMEDQSGEFIRVYMAIRDFMTMHPDKGFQDVEALLKANRCKSRMLAYLAPKEVSEQPQWPPGTVRKYHLFIATNPRSGEWHKKLKAFGLSFGKDNSSKLAECGFSHFWLRNNFRLHFPSSYPLAPLQGKFQGLKMSADLGKVLSKIPGVPKPEQLEDFSDIWAKMPVEKMSDELRPVQVPLSIIIGVKLGQYSPGPGQILEIGSGYFPVTEHAVIFPKERFHLSDRLPACVEHIKKTYPGQTVSLFDVHAPADGQIEGSFQTIVMCDVMNTFTSEQIKTAARSVYNRLEPGGYLLNFSIRETVFLHLIDEAEKNGYLFCPFMDVQGLWTGVYTIEKGEFSAQVKKLKLEHTSIQTVLTEYASLDPAMRQSLFLPYCEGDHSSVPYFKLLADGFQMLKCPSIQLIYFDTEHFRSMNEVLQTVGFKLIESQKESRSCVGPRSQRHPPNGNRFSFNSAEHKVDFDKDLDAGLVEENATVHVIVAQKPLLEERTEIVESSS